MIDFKSDTAIYQQVAMYFEQKIRNGELIAGDRLPTTMELAKQLGVNRETIQLGLKLLMNQGLISRSPKRGTFVKEYARQQVLGIVLPQSVYTDSDIVFYPVLYASLAQYAARLGWQARYFITSPGEQIDNGFYDLRKAVDAGELRGIVHVSGKESPVGAYLRRECPVPEITMPTLDFKQMVGLGLDRLRKSSYSRIDLYFPVLHGEEAIRQEAESILANYCRSRKVDRGLLKAHFVPGHYEAAWHYFREQWGRDAERPEAILITLDALFHGIWNAILELKIDVPEKLGVITHTNQKLIPRTHIPVTALEISTDEMAQLAFDTFLARNRGENVRKLKIGCRLEEGKTCRTIQTSSPSRRRGSAMNPKKNI